MSTTSSHAFHSIFPFSQTPGMITLPLTVLWSRQTKAAAIISPSVGILSGIGVWLGTAAHYAEPFGTLNVTTTGALLPCLWGTITATVVPIILTPTISLIWPTERFDWARFSDIKLVSNDDSSSIDSDEKVSKVPTEEEKETLITPDQEKYMRSRSWLAGWVSLFLFVAVWIVWPCEYRKSERLSTSDVVSFANPSILPSFSSFLLPVGMYGARYVFSRQFFQGWVVVSIIWVFAALLIVFFLPLWEGKDLLVTLARGALGLTPAHPKIGETAQKLPESRDETLAESPREETSNEKVQSVN